MFAMPVSGNGAKMALMVYPAKKEDLLKDNPAIDKPVFPGIKVGVYDVEMGFDGQKIVDKAIGSPILPCLMVKEPIKSTSTIPSRDDFLAAISSTLRMAVWPEMKQNERTLSASWAAIRDKGEGQLSKDPPPAIWPEYVVVEPSTGRKKF